MATVRARGKQQSNWWGTWSPFTKAVVLFFAAFLALLLFVDALILVSAHLRSDGTGRPPVQVRR